MIVVWKRILFVTVLGLTATSALANDWVDTCMLPKVGFVKAAACRVRLLRDQAASATTPYVQRGIYALASRIERIAEQVTAGDITEEEAAERVKLSNDQYASEMMPTGPVCDWKQGRVVLYRCMASEFRRLAVAMPEKRDLFNDTAHRLDATALNIATGGDNSEETEALGKQLRGTINSPACLNMGLACR